MKVTERFLRYVSFDTQSAEHSTTTPSTEKQKVLGEVLATELSQMGLRGAHMDDKGYVYGWLPATPGCEGVPCVGLIAHMDTSPDAPGANVRARVCRYEWVQDLSRQCQRAGVPFHFRQTGALFEKDGRLYRIPRQYQSSQARKAGIDSR